MTSVELLLALTPGLPALLALFWPVAFMRASLRALAPWAALPGLILALHPAGQGAVLVVPAFFTGLRLEVDGIGRAFLLLTALLWSVAGAFARSYHASDRHRDGFFGFFVLTMAGNLGLVIAGDILSFYLFFACMTFGAYGLVVHRRDREALRAGRIYIVLAVLGELAVLSVLIALGWSSGGIPAFGGELDLAWRDLGAFGGAGLAASLAVVGFGVKAGLVPLHLWLPLAHPVAPTAASALLSGAMIKGGLLAWLRYLPGDDTLPLVGAALMAAGVVSAFYGVVVGLAQDDPKTVLAYSSVSQMGYMALGVGMLLATPGWAPAAILAMVLYALHHGVAKGALFLAVGVGDRVPGGKGGVWGKVVLAGAALPALALAGAPLTSGAQAKNALKAALPDLAPGWYPVLDPVLLVAAGGTMLLMVRFLATLQRRIRPEKSGEESPASSGRGPWGLVVPWAILVLVGVAGPLWLPRAFPAPEGVAFPGVFSGLIGAALPVLAGGVVGWLIWRRPALLRGLEGLRIPAGDLVVLLEVWAPGVWRAAHEDFLAVGGRWIGRFRGAQLWGHGRAAWVAERDLYLARGPVVAILLLALALGLAGLLS